MLADAAAAAVFGGFVLHNAAEVVRARLHTASHTASPRRHRLEHHIIQRKPRSCRCWQLAVARHARLRPRRIRVERHPAADVCVANVVVEGRGGAGRAGCCRAGGVAAA
jgi:hypothetical protein